jgi:hypothetical protein
MNMIKKDSRDTNTTSKNKFKVTIENINKNEMELDEIKYLTCWMAKNINSPLFLKYVFVR